MFQTKKINEKITIHFRLYCYNGCSEDEGVFYPSKSPEMCYYITGLKSYTPDCDGVVLSFVYSGEFESEDYEPIFILCVIKKRQKLILFL